MLYVPDTFWMSCVKEISTRAGEVETTSPFPGVELLYRAWASAVPGTQSIAPRHASTATATARARILRYLRARAPAAMSAPLPAAMSPKTASAVSFQPSPPELPSPVVGSAPPLVAEG